MEGFIKIHTGKPILSKIVQQFAMQDQSACPGAIFAGRVNWIILKEFIKKRTLDSNNAAHIMLLAFDLQAKIS